jgi:type I restriction enzyme, S subunit
MAMKNSGIEWIGDIPSDWEINKLKYITMNANTGEAISKEFWDSDGDYLLYTAGQFPIRSTFNEFPKNIMTTENDILVARNGAGAVQIPQLGSIYTDHVIRFTIKIGSSLKFIYYTLLLGMEKIVSEAIDVSLKTLSRSDWDNLSLPFPVLSEQSSIAAFLDTQCSKIDNIITELEQQIEILKQYKTSLITETVTKGLNKNAPMRNSGIDWIGKIPAHWEMRKVKYMLDLKSGDSLTNDMLLDDDTLYPVFGGGKQMGYYEKSNVNSNNILIGRVGANCGCITKVIEKAWATDNALIVYSNENLDYLYYILLSADFNNMSDTNAQPLITASKVLNIKIPFCKNIQEQKAIAAFLDSKCKEITDIIIEKQQSIDTMKAYKKSLIYEYVTGKKRVKGYS